MTSRPSMAPGPSMAPHLLAEKAASAGLPCQGELHNSEQDGMSRKDQRQQKAAYFKQKQLRELERNKLSSDAKSVQKLRRIVKMAYEAEPSYFQGETRFGAVASAVERHCGMSRSEFARFLISGFGIQTPADAIRVYCSDLVTLRGYGNGMKTRDDLDLDPAPNPKKRRREEYNDINKEMTGRRRDQCEASLDTEGEAPLDSEDLAADVSSLPVLGNVRSLSKHPAGCRRVQAYIADAADEADCLAVAEEFMGHISEAAACPHSNFVLLKLINTLSPESLEPILEELLGEGTETVVEISQHRYSCRIIQEFLSRCAPDQMQPLVDDLLPHAYDLCKHMYGNLVMQAIVEHGTEKVRQDIFQLLKVHISSLGTSFYGSAMVGACMKQADDAEQLAIARATIGVNGLLAALWRFKHGRVVADSILNVLSGEEREAALYQLHKVTPLKIEKPPKGARARF